jgi:uncharacterized membrane protein YgdD (TMEM256/DUF423 family)
MWTRFAGLSGASAVALGAYGAHGLKREANFVATFATGSNYHLLHSVMLASCAMSLTGRKRLVCCTLFATGIVLFSGSCYTVALMEQRKPYSYPAPIGGLALVAGWGALALL